MIVLVNKYLVPFDHKAITLFPFVILRSAELKKNTILLNHERIHIRQQAEMLVIFFYLWYGLEFLYRFARLCNRKKAYRAISFEKEAFQNERDLDYLKLRRFWNWTRQL